MSPSNAAEPARTGTATAYWASAYFLSVATLYLWAYWFAFNVNVLEYVSVADIVKTAVFPIATIFVFIALGAIAGEAMFPRGFLPAGGGTNGPVGRALRRAAPVVAAVYAVSVFLLLFFGPVEKWRVLPILIAIPMSLGLKEAGLLQRVIKSDSTRTVLIFLLAALPPFAYGHGTLRANDIRSGLAFSYVASAIEGHFVDAEAPVTERLRYVGKAGETYFLFEPSSRSLLAIHHAHVKLLQLQTYTDNIASAESKIPRGSASAPTSAAASSR